jgi:ElaA protein
MSDVSAIDLYQILKLRQDIFIIEQNCTYDDIDNIDTCSEHIYLKNNNQVIAYSRIVPAGTKFHHPSIGRIIVHKSFRGKGFGREVVQRALKVLSERETEAVFIEAQNHLKEFYESIGFKQLSEPYPIDGIQHIKMIHEFNP